MLHSFLFLYFSCCFVVAALAPSQTTSFVLEKQERGRLLCFSETLLLRLRCCYILVLITLVAAVWRLFETDLK